MRDASAMWSRSLGLAGGSVAGRALRMRSRLWQWLTGRPPPALTTRSSAEATTQLPPSRGQAMREAHRVLRARMNGHPAIRQVLPHLSAVERALAKRGSRALMRIPLSLLCRAVDQLTVLQDDNENPAEAFSLRVLRLRMLEIIALRVEHGSRDNDAAARAEAEAPATDGVAASGMSGTSDLSSSAFDEADQAWSQMKMGQR